MKYFNTAACVAACLLSAQVQAEAGKPLLSKSQMSVGAGLSQNDVDVPGVGSETGLQFFMAYDLNRVNLIDGTKSSVELGYMDYGFDGRNNSGGLWTTFVVGGAIRENLNWLARLGLDLGDDSGLMLGGGVGFALSSSLQLRVEYVVRDDIDSIQLNFIHHL